MIRQIKGIIIEKKEKFIVLDVNGLGFKIFLSQNNLEKLPPLGEEIHLFSFLKVSENNLELYGFLNKEELDFFEMVKNVRGIGAKASLEISSLGPIEKIKEKILDQDDKIFEGIPGIGKRKAMAIILELTGKIKDVSNKRSETVSNEAEEALINLGFSREKARFALKQVPEDIKEPEEKIKVALKILGK